MRERIASWDVVPERVRVGFDMSFLTQKPDQSSQALAGWAQGVLSLNGVAELLKVPKSSLAVIPDGMAGLAWSLFPESARRLPTPFSDIHPRPRARCRIDGELDHGLASNRELRTPHAGSCGSEGCDRRLLVCR